eukprot:1031571-Alexandrium_andersonii.AAC.1
MPFRPGRREMASRPATVTTAQPDTATTTCLLEGPSRVSRQRLSVRATDSCGICESATPPGRAASRGQ